MALYLRIILTREKSIHIYNTRAPDAGAWGPLVLRGECEEVFVFELSGTHELHRATINTRHQVATT